MLCCALDVNRAELLEGLHTNRNSADSQTRENVNAWWDHKQQPTKSQSLDDLKKFLTKSAKAKRSPLKVGTIWNAELTPLEFARRCGLDRITAMSVVSDTCRLSAMELVDSIPFIRDLLEWQRAAPPADPMLGPGTYLIYRVHSSEGDRREILTIERKASDLFERAVYLQDAERRAQREIQLTVFRAHLCAHAVGAYTDSKAGGQQRKSLVHLIVFDSPFRTDLFSGIMSDLIDNGTAVSAQRVLVRRINTSVTASKNLRVKRDSAEDWKLIKAFLQNDENQFFLFADYTRLSSMLSRVSSLAPRSRAKR